MMAIKVKHEGNVTSRITAAAKGGRGRRAAEDGKAWMQIAASEAMAGNRQLQGAHASPVSPGHATVQLTHAPTGAAPGIMHAPAGGVGAGGRGGGGGSSSMRSASADTGASRRLKVTGTKFFERPDKESVWDQDSRQWVREYLPGEWEAEVQQRVGDVKNAQEQEMYDYRLSSQQKNEIAAINNALEEARKSGRYTPEEMEKLERQADAKRLGIKPLPTPKEEDPETVFKKNTYTDTGGRIFTTDGELVYDPGTAEQRRMEYQMRMHDAEEKRYQDALMKLQQGYRTAEPVYKMNEFGTEIVTDASGNPVVEKYNSVYKPYTEEQQQAILQRLFPNRFANVAQPTASAPGIVIDPTTGAPMAVGMAALNQQYPGAPLAQTPQPAPTSAAPAPQPAAQPQAQAAPPPTAPEDEKKKYAVNRWGVK